MGRPILEKFSDERTLRISSRVKTNHYEDNLFSFICKGEDGEGYGITIVSIPGFCGNMSFKELKIDMPEKGEKVSDEFIERAIHLYIVKMKELYGGK